MTSKSPVCFLPVWASVFTAVCEPVCVRGGGHDKGLHLVIIAGCMISCDLPENWFGEWCACGVCVAEGRVLTERSTYDKFAVRNSHLN